MAVTTTNLIQGPATLYTGAVGNAEPTSIAGAASGAAPSTGWTDVGGTKEGITLAIADTWSDLEVDQLVIAADSRRTMRKVTIKTVMAEATLGNLAIGISNSAPASGLLQIDDGLANGGFLPTFYALIIDGTAPGGFRRRIKVRKVLSVASVEMAYKKDGETLIPVTFQAYYVSSSIRAAVIEDAIS
jgi:hypothetical protein